jgi:hypothetical protein
MSPTSYPTSSSPTTSPIQPTSQEPSSIPTISPSVFPTPRCPPIRRNVATASPHMTEVNGNNNRRKLFEDSQRLVREHQFYTPQQYEPRGRSVGSRNPVLPPSECPEFETSIVPNKTKTDLPVDIPLELKQIMKKSKLDKREPIDDIKGGDIQTNKILPVPKKMPKTNDSNDDDGDGDDDDDDDVSFITIQKSSVPSQTPINTNTPAKSVHDTNSLVMPQFKDTNVESSVSLSPSRAPTTTLHHLEKQYENHVAMMHKGMKDKKTRRRR